MKVVVAEFMDAAALQEFGAGIAVRYAPELADDRQALLGAVADADALIVRNRVQVDAELLAAAARLRAVGRLGVGLDNIDLRQCAERGIAVCPATGANAQSVAEYVLGAAFVLRRRAYAANADMLAGRWPRQSLAAGRELAGCMLGLYGFGAVARQVARRAAALGVAVAACDPQLARDDPAWDGVQQLSGAQLLAAADVLSLHVPLTGQTRGLIDAPALAQMKPGAVLINTARGGIVDEQALAAALRAGRLCGAALDVFAVEPLDAAAAAQFADVPNLILTPHIAGVTAEGNVRVSRATVANVARELARA